MALAEEAVLEREGGGEDRSFDLAVERFLGDRRPALELTQDFKFPARPVWQALEQVFLSDPHDLELLEIRGGEVGDGGIAIFGALTRWGGNAIYQSYMRKLEHTLGKILTRVERDLEREATEKRGGLPGP